MTTALNTDAKPWSAGPMQPAKSASRIVLGLTLAVSLALVGVVFFSLAIAFPAVLAVAPSFPTLISASDIALATQLAAVWPLFVVASIAFFVASLAVIVKLVQRVDPSPAA